MLIFPAIDLLDGQVVRLYQGDYGQKQVFGENPAQFATQFAEDGATCLHLVDLNGAKTGKMQNFAAVEAITTAQPNLFAELGGGIRDEETIQQCLDAGVGRVILGTAALKNPTFTRQMLAKHGSAIAIGVDARDGRVATEGWLDTSDTDSLSFCREMQQLGAQYIIYTDIARDGAGRGTNLGVYEKLSTLQGLNITASGGVSSLEDVAALRQMGLYAAILGKALYTGTVKLKEALQTAKGEEIV